MTSERRVNFVELCKGEVRTVPSPRTESYVGRALSLCSLHKNSYRIGTELRIILGWQLPRIPIPRTSVNKGLVVCLRAFR
jgi:hypothetical protein